MEGIVPLIHHLCSQLSVLYLILEARAMELDTSMLLSGAVVPFVVVPSFFHCSFLTQVGEQRVKILLRSIV